MKKLLLSLFMLIPLMAWAEEIFKGGVIEMEPTGEDYIIFADANVKRICDIRWDTNDDGELSYSEAAAVQSLGNVFKKNSGITSFDELQYFTGLTSIGDYAFHGCSSLTSVTIPLSVTSIGDYAFHGCSSLTSMTIPEGVTYINWGTFSGCSGLTSVTIPEGVTSIGNYAFNVCSSLTSVTIPEGVTSIGDDAFSGCSGLTSVTIPSSVTSIGSYAFYGCTGLTSVTIPEGVTKIWGYAFNGCSGLTSVTIPSSVTSIGNYAFRNCSGLTSVTSYIQEPFKFGSSAFNSISASCILYVPAGTRDAYIAKGWTEEIFKGGVIEMEGEDENNQLQLTDASALRGTQVELPVQLTNTADNVVGVNYTLTLPSGVTVALDEDSEPIYTLNSSRVNSKHFSVTAVQQSDGSWGFRLYTTNANGVISGTEGEIMTITLNVDGAMEAGDYQVSLTDNKLSVRDNSNNVSTLNMSDAVSTLTVTALAMGDVNGDEEVDLSDAIMVIYHSLNITSAAFHAEVADMNGDGEIDLSDAITIIYRSLGLISSQAKGREGADTISDTFDRLEAETESNACALHLSNDTPYLGLQFDMELPYGMEVGDILLSGERARDFTALYNHISDNTYRVLVFSAGGKVFSGNEGELLRLMTEGTGNGLLRITNIFGVNSRLEKKRFVDININATGISSLNADADALKNSYDLSGRKVNRLQNGMMIVNGKKTYIK